MTHDVAVQNKIKERRRSLRLGQAELSWIVDVSISTLSRYEAGDHRADRLVAPAWLILLLDAWLMCPDALIAAKQRKDTGQ